MRAINVHACCTLGERHHTLLVAITSPHALIMERTHMSICCHTMTTTFALAGFSYRACSVAYASRVLATKTVGVHRPQMSNRCIQHMKFLPFSFFCSGNACACIGGTLAQDRCSSSPSAAWRVTTLASAGPETASSAACSVTAYASVISAAAWPVFFCFAAA